MTRVPIATLLMVAEMTGGYQLFVPAALAVMISSFVQMKLSERLRYSSLYEAQVPSRADSPAHHVEHLEIALRLLRERRVAIPETISHLDLRSLLASGLPVDLPDGKQMILWTVPSKSLHIDRPIQEALSVTDPDELEIVALFRLGHTLLPHGELELQAGDQVLAIASPQAWGQLMAQLSPLPG